MDAALTAELDRLRAEVARLRAEREALAHFAAVIDPHDERDASLQTLVGALVRVLHGRSGALYRYSSDQRETVAAYFAGYPDPEAARRIALAQPLARIPFERELCRTEQASIAAVTPDEWDRPSPVITAGLRPLLALPVQRAGHVGGCLAIERAPQDPPFTAHDLAFGLDLAVQAVLMIERADERATMQQRATRAEAMREIGRELSAELDFDRFLDSAAQHLTTVMAVEDCWLGRWDEAAQELRILLYVCAGVRQDWPAVVRLDDGRALASDVIRERATIHVPDYLLECQRRDLEPVTMTDGDWHSLAWIGVPLLTGGRIVGVMAVERHGAIFTTEEVALFEALGGHIAAAMENARLYAEVRHLASADPLTGLANHRHIHERLEQELARARRHERPLAVAMLDLNNFKHYNDTYGHQAGDQLLRTIAQALRDEARVADVVGRYGGDEFLVVLPETTREGAVAMLARVQQRLAAIPRLFGAETTSPVTTSVGVAVFPGDADQAHELIALADRGLYADKRAHRVRPTRPVGRPRIPA